LHVSDIAELIVPPGTKGLPLDGSIQRVGDLASRGLNLLRGDLPMPVAVLKRSALDNNLSEMQAYIERVGIQLAPHAKTTMCPQLFTRQLEHGAWGLTVATMTQFKLCHDFGVPRLILANELVGRAEVEGLARLWAQAPERDYYVLVDSMPRWWYRDGRHTAPRSIEGLNVYKLNDQHAYLSVPQTADLAVGDLLGFAISHPCTTFDKWSLLMEVADDYTVIGGLKTFF
jgi:D-serine deaminase-like pyridoxal phosphate-dependent protein